MTTRQLVELTEQFHPWDEEGQTLEGFLGPNEEISVGDEGGTTLRRYVTTEEGDIAFLSPPSLERWLGKVEDGVWVKILYESNITTKNGIMKKFKVWVEQPE